MYSGGGPFGTEFVDSSASFRPVSSQGDCSAVQSISEFVKFSAVSVEVFCAEVRNNCPEASSFLTPVRSDSGSSIWYENKNQQKAIFSTYSVHTSFFHVFNLCCDFKQDIWPPKRPFCWEWLLQTKTEQAGDVFMLWKQ